MTAEKDFTTTFTLEIPTQYTVTAHGLYGGVMGITPGEDYTARYTVGAQVGLQIGKRDGFTLAGSDARGNQRRAAAMAGEGRGKHNSRYFLRDARA